MAETHWNNLGAYLKETQILGSIQNTLYWDQNTGMPKKGASWRSEQLTYIAKVLHERNSSEEFSNLIQSAKNENADPNVLRDLKKYMQSIVPYDSYLTLSKNREEISYKHYQEGTDDMPAHIKTSLTNTCLSLSFQDGKIMLGTWQAVYLWEHRFDQKERIINVHLIGEKK